MFTIKCMKADGVMHVYEAEGWTKFPEAENEKGEFVTTVESWQPKGANLQHHVAYSHDIHYAEIFIENAEGKTIHVIRPVSTGQ